MGILVNNNNNTKRERLEKIQKDILDYKADGSSVKAISDGYHTFDELYHHRMILSSIIFNSHRDIAWKSYKHEDGTMFDGMFIVGVTTPEGDYSYHYHLEHWDLFDVPEVKHAPVYDGHMPSDITRLLSI